MRVVGYVRVSTREQAEHGLGLDVQERSIRKWAKANGHRLVAIHADAGVSGSNGVEDRIGLPLVLEAVRDGQVDALVVARLDRLARALTVQEATLAAVWRMGGRLFTVDSGEVLPDDPDDPMRTAMRQMVGVFSELERRMVVKRLRDGRRRKAELGGFAFGSPSYGQRAEAGVLVDDEREAAALSRIRELHEEGASLRAMAATLTTEGHRPKRSDRWHPQSLARIVARL
ncbi:DNA invertase Pin-like site-specific DNA recombinase [Blastococcus colisei]|uniref:DNA invertase Pin-like site-specific DNA recombinase n=1 Tax=Blastococcus colisei TaxID=1564162 RepID=A0A543PK12_9ACTN|nr:recombinase family protein [Blastococcus colisei]TQN44407.1 DNA invertase Pin-like site-specific DNA recombinase [Blastococcus colisei]